MRSIFASMLRCILCYQRINKNSTWLIRKGGARLVSASSWGVAITLWLFSYLDSRQVGQSVSVETRSCVVVYEFLLLFCELPICVDSFQFENIIDVFHLCCVYLISWNCWSTRTIYSIEFMWMGPYPIIPMDWWTRSLYRLIIHVNGLFLEYISIYIMYCCILKHNFLLISSIAFTEYLREQSICNLRVLTFAIESLIT